MTRPLRLEFSGALYHVTSRGDRRELVYKDGYDRVARVDILGTVALSFAEYETKYSDWNEGMARAYLSTANTMAEIGKHFGVAYRTVSRAVRAFQQDYIGKASR